MRDDVFAAAEDAWREGRFAEAEAILRTALGDRPPDARTRASLENIAFMMGRAPPPPTVEARVRLARSLATTQGPVALKGADEGARLQQAVDLLLPVLDRIPEPLHPTTARVLWQVADYGAVEGLTEQSALRRQVAAAGSDEVLRQIPRAETDEDRLDILEMHRAWARAIEARVPDRIASVGTPAAEAGKGFRLGFLSSDLRHHVVANFVQPLFEFRDPRFDIYVYTSAHRRA